MGRKDNDTELQDFSEESLANRELVISMLKYTDTLFLGPGQELYRNQCYLPNSSIDPLLAIQRKVLNDFGFKNDTVSLGNFRKIVQIYWRGPDDYDAEVLQSVVYLRANKLLYYRGAVLPIGSLAKDCRLLNLDGSETSLAEHWKLDTIVCGIAEASKASEFKKQRVLVCAFSGS